MMEEHEQKLGLFHIAVHCPVKSWGKGTLCLIISICILYGKFSQFHFFQLFAAAYLGDRTALMPRTWHLRHP